MSTFERRFCLDKLPNVDFVQSVKIHQVYWRIGNDWSIRIRKETLPTDFKYTITIKGPRDGVDRPEIKTVMFNGISDNERDEQLQVLNAFLSSGVQHSINKTRHYTELDGQTWEIDVFEGKAEGLIIAEVHSPNKEFVQSLRTPQNWGTAVDVTADSTYNNENLAYDSCAWLHE